MKWFFSVLILLPLIPVFFSCGNEKGKREPEKETTLRKETSTLIREDPVTYTVENPSFRNTTMNGFFAYDQIQTGRRPIVLIVPEWWGLTEYPRMRARMLAQMGYLAMAVDMYGFGKLAPTPEEAQKTSAPFYTAPMMAKERLDAALATARKHPLADTTKVFAIGYCFGGSMVLNYAKMGAPVLGVVSFHGGLQGVPPQKGLKAQFLICHGSADNFVPQSQIHAFKKSMDSAGAAYTFKVYEGATHAFTNPIATEKGKEFNMPIGYSGAADTASWNDMKEFFSRLLK
jgi:dienelactone hydrolase